MDKNRKIKIFWLDAVIYADKVPSRLARKITEGNLVKERDGYVLVKNPITSIYSEKEKSYIPKEGKGHKFFFVPSGMIEKIES